MVMAALGALKLVCPDCLSSWPSLSYGRLQPASQSLLVYGFASQAIYAVMLWMLARLGQMPWRGTGWLFAGGLLWNMAVLLGVGGILFGDQSGFAWFALPRPAGRLLLAGHLCITLAALANVRHRRNATLHPAQWYLLAALCWFAGLLWVSQSLLLWQPVQGVMQTVIHAWLGSGLVHLWLGVSGLGMLLFFVPKLANRPLHNPSLAQFAFWLFALFGAGCALHPGLPLPRWLPAISAVCQWLLLPAMLALALCLFKTLAGNLDALNSERSLLLMVIGFFSWCVALILGGILHVPEVAALTEYTWFATARDQLFLAGFILPVLTGALAYLIPRLTGREWPCHVMPKVHVYGTLLGTAVLVGALVLGGIQQVLAASPEEPFIQVVRATRLAGGGVLAGWIILATAQFSFIVNFTWLLCRCLKPCPTPEREATHSESLENMSVAEAPVPRATWQNHAWLPGLAAVLTLALSFGGLILVPQWQLGRPQPVARTALEPTYPLPRPGQAEQGREWYRSLGCAECHTQQLRPAGTPTDLARGWGTRRTVAQDFAADSLVFPGTIRLGPDLASIGDRRPERFAAPWKCQTPNPEAEITQWHLRHLYDPRQVSPGSLMPSYRFLFEERELTPGRLPSASALPPDTRSGLSQGKEMVPKPGALALTAYLLSLRAEAAVYAAPLTPKTAGDDHTTILFQPSR